MERVVNIIGLGYSGLDCPDTGETWVLNCAYKRTIGKKVDKMFYMDDLMKHVLPSDPIVEPFDYTFDKFLKDNPELEIICKCKDKITDLEGNIIKETNMYPLNDAIKLTKNGYFTSTIAYTICYAILQKVDRIRLYGFEIWSGSDANEYMYQRPCVDFWIAFALARGIRVEVPYMTMMNVTNKQNYYGYIRNDLYHNMQ